MATDPGFAAELHPGSVDTPSDGASGASGWMRRCIALARRGAGHVSPNPMVGAVLVDAHGEILAEGWHAKYGEAHAEARAIHTAIDTHGPDALRRATLYVNLEPCSHHGKTPPCSNLIVDVGIPRVVVGTVDPYPEVAGRGIERMRAHGIDVTVGVEQDACKRLNEAFFHHVTTGRPLVTLKIAQTLDGRIATTTGHSQWISGAESRTQVHRWRAELDGVLVGSGTAAADDPRLTVRHVDGPQPHRIVLDRTGTLSPELHLFTDGHTASTMAVVGAERAAPAYAETLTAQGGQVVRIPETLDDHLDLQALLTHLGAPDGPVARPLQSLLVEAGPGLATALFQQDLVDRFFCFIAPKVVGTGMPSLHDLGIRRMDNALTFADQQWTSVGEDLLFKGYMRSV